MWVKLLFLIVCIILEELLEIIKLGMRKLGESYRLIWLFNFCKMLVIK